MLRSSVHFIYHNYYFTDTNCFLILGDYRLSRVRYHLLGLAYWTAGSAYCRGSWNGGNLMYDNGLLSSMSSDWWSQWKCPSKTVSLKCLVRKKLNLCPFCSLWKDDGKKAVRWTYLAWWFFFNFVWKGIFGHIDQHRCILID